MSDKLAARKYTNALVKSQSTAELEKSLAVLEKLVALFGSKKFLEIIRSPLVSSSDKCELVLSAVDTKDPKIINLIKLLADKSRLVAIPSIADEIRAVLSSQKGFYSGEVFSSKPLESKEVEALSDALSKKLGSKIELSISKKPYDGVKVVVSDLGVEVDFSKAQVRSQILGHILKAL